MFSVPEGVSARNRVLKMYRGSARARGLLWALPKKFFFELTQMNCHYCGVPPSTASSNTRGTYLYNGIDRKDSSMGYLKWNVVACCTVCNHAKKDMSYSTFVEWLKRVAQFWRRDA